MYSAKLTSKITIPTARREMTSVELAIFCEKKAKL